MIALRQTPVPYQHGTSPWSDFPDGWTGYSPRHLAAITACFAVMPFGRCYAVFAQLTQELVGRWLDEGGCHHISGFLHWAAHHGLTEDLQVPRRRPGKPQPAVSEQNRWSTVSRCLNDTTMPTDVRAAGALRLL